MLQGLAGRDALVRVLLEQLLHQVLRGLRDVLPLAITELILAAHVLIKNLVGAVASKQRPAREHNVKDHTDTEDVSLAIVALLLQQLGCHIPRAATPQVQLLRAVFKHRGQAKIGNLQVPIVLLRRQQQILRLQVAMHDVASVEVLQRTYEVSHDGSRRRLTILTLALDLVEKFTALQIWQEQMNILCCLVGLVELDYVFVVDGAQDVDFRQDRLLQ